ncbi:hypothetical protein [Peptostreptococcus stomatis]|uniref:hypothetical protein n=1 Tax=Peptostreptococcus stomatis TaxID=341694 RepID=UPI0024A7EA16|nr:hypothetical protein [Peptostreptococcus stomatis]
MIVAFLDLLGFSELLQTDINIAFSNINLLNNIIETRYNDNKIHPLLEYKEKNPDDMEFLYFVEKSSITSFENVISFSDSLILAGTDYDLFIMQLVNFVASAYSRYSKPFRKPFNNIHEVSTCESIGRADGKDESLKAFPILLRGGISIGEDISFFKEYHIHDGNKQRTSLNVIGLAYLKAVKLESFDKGPRLFCDKSVAEAVNENVLKFLREVDKDKGIYEIVWTKEGLDTIAREGRYDRIDKWKNVEVVIDEVMLPPAINLYKYYEKKESLKEHYEQLIKLVCRGIVKYAADECNRMEDAIRQVNDKLIKNSLPDNLLIDKSILDDFNTNK